MIQLNNINCVIETGTYVGNTTEWFCKVVPEVHSIEINPELYNISVSKLSQYPHCHLHLGNSSEVLKEILKIWMKINEFYFIWMLIGENIGL
jgi:predicted O-methyltransferase YrrM